MLRTLLAVVVTWGGLALWAQPQPQPKQPRVRSPKEGQAIQAISISYQAGDFDGAIKAAEELLNSFADTEFKGFALQMEVLAYQQKDDFEKMLLVGERALEVDGDNVVVLITLAQAIPQRTREFDLDKEEKLGKADKFARKAQTLIPNLPKHNPQISDEDWGSYKRGAMAQAHESVGMVAFVRKDYAGAEKSFRTAAEVSPQVDANIFFRLGMALSAQNKADDAIQALDKAIAAGGVQVGGKDLAKEQKAALEKAKAAGAKPAAPAAPAAPPVEIKRP